MSIFTITVTGDYYLPQTEEEAIQHYDKMLEPIFKKIFGEKCQWRYTTYPRIVDSTNPKQWFVPDRIAIVLNERKLYVQLIEYKHRHQSSKEINAQYIERNYIINSGLYKYFDSIKNLVLEIIHTDSEFMQNFDDNNIRNNLGIIVVSNENEPVLEDLIKKDPAHYFVICQFTNPNPNRRQLLLDICNHLQNKFAFNLPTEKDDNSLWIYRHGRSKRDAYCAHMELLFRSTHPKILFWEIHFERINIINREYINHTLTNHQFDINKIFNTKVILQNSHPIIIIKIAEYNMDKINPEEIAKEILSTWDNFSKFMIEIGLEKYW